MANTNSPFGFRLVRDRTNGGSVPYTLVATYATKLGKGDPVALTGSGPNVERAAGDAVTVIGVVNGFEYTDVGGQRQWATYWPGNVGYTDVKVIVDPVDSGEEWEVQTDTCAVTDIGAHADATVADASATLARSQTVLAASSTGTSGKLFRIDRLKETSAYGAYAVVIGRFVEGANLHASGGV